MTQLINSVNSGPVYAKIVKIDMNNNLILAHEQGEHHHKEGHHEEKKEGHHEEKVEAKEEKEGEEKEHHKEAKEEKEGHHEEKEGHHEEKEREEGEEVPAFVPTTDFTAEYIIYFGAGLLSIALIAVFILWAQRYSDSNE